MPRSRWLVLVPAIALSAACTRGDDVTTGDPLSRDVALAAQLQLADGGQRLTSALDPKGCEPGAPRTPPADGERREATTLLRRAQQAEWVGDTPGARILLRRAALLDSTNHAVAYHLARADETLGYVSDAVEGYCRYLSLGPSTGEATEARTRLATLSTLATAGRQGAPAAQAPQAVQPAAEEMAPARRTATATRKASAVAERSPAPRARAAHLARRVPAPARTEVVSATPAVVPADTSITAPSQPAAPANPGRDSAVSVASVGTAEGVGSSAGSTESPVAVDTARAPEPANAGEPAVRPTPAPPSGQRGQVARGAVIGAAAGAVMGAVIGRDVRGAVIGAAAGGLLGAAGGGMRSRTGFRTPGFARP
jgi:hypothetical protein